MLAQVFVLMQVLVLVVVDISIRSVLAQVFVSRLTHKLKISRTQLPMFYFSRALIHKWRLKK